MILEGYLYGAVVFGLFFVMAIIRRVVNKEGIRAFLIHFDERGIRLFLKGLLMGTAVFMAYLLVTLCANQCEVSINTGVPGDTVAVLLVSVFMFLAIALFEEALYRGYLMQKIKEKFSVRTGILVPSVIFGLWHFMAYSEDQYFLIGLFNALLYAVLMSLMALKYNSIMLNIGFHLVWNVFQSMVFSTANLQINTLISIDLKESLMTGSSSNPETGFIMTIIFGTLLVYYFIKDKELGVLS